MELGEGWGLIGEGWGLIGEGWGLIIQENPLMAGIKKNTISTIKKV